MIMGKSILCLIVSILLAGCTLPSLTGDPSKDLPAMGSTISSIDTQAQQTIAAVDKFTLADLQAADADAQANSDTAAHSCYGALIPVVEARANQSASAVGAVSTFQHTRDIVKLFKGSGAVAQACAALKQDVTGDVLGIGALLGLP